MKQGFLITNNPAVYEGYSGRAGVAYLEGKKFMDVLYFARDKIHTGHKLLSHPLSGSIKPGQTPYKSIFISEEKGELDDGSLRIIENSISTADKHIAQKEELLWPDEILKDFQLIDFELIGGKNGKDI